MKKLNQFVFLAVIFLLLGGTFISAQKAQIQVIKLEKEVYDKSLMSFNLTRQRIESYLNSLQDKITIKSYQSADKLRNIFLNPDDNEYLLKEIQEKVKNELTNVNLSTLANAQGEIIVTDFDGYISEICQTNLENFSKNNQFEIRIHPNSEQYHFDIMVQYNDPMLLSPGIFFTSFSAGHLTKILKQGEKDRNHFFLMFNKIPDLIEVSSEGDRLQMTRNTRLSNGEMKRINIRKSINNTSWTLVNLPPENLLKKQKNSLYMRSIMEILFLYFISAILFYGIYNEVAKNKKISERYLLFLEKTDISFFVIDRKGIVQYGNSALLKIAEVDELNDIISESVLTWMDLKMWEQIQESLKTVDKKGKIIGVSIKQRCKNGQLKNFQMDIIADHSAKQIMYAIFCKDMSEINQIEHLKFERQAAVLSEQSKTEFLANISHELRTPMHGILSYASMGVKRINDASKEQLEKYFTNIGISGKRLLALLNDLLDLSKLEAGQMNMSFVSYDLNLIVKDALMEQQSNIDEQGLQVIFHINDTIETKIELDNIRITQVVANLLSNAIKFTSEKGIIEILIYSDYLTHQNIKTEAISLSIKNDSEGIPEDDLEFIFGKFKQSNNMSSGTKKGSTGLGLAICKEIIELHNGIIFARSEQGKSATFVFTLPVKQIKNSL